jgi:tetratricopeptide (TPR) repeat protein
VDEARAMYEELYANGEIAASYMLPYAVLLLRSGEEGAFEKVKEIMIKAQKAPDMNPERKQQLLMNYAVASWKTGGLEKSVKVLEASHREAPCGLTYQALGFLYVEYGDADQALKYNLEALDYDDEDSVILDNLGQTYYRLLHDKKKARTYFEKAHDIKPGQIDTLYFLSRYDLEEGKPEAALEKIEKALEGRFSPLNYVSRQMAEDEAARIKQILPGGEE